MGRGARKLGASGGMHGIHPTMKPPPLSQARTKPPPGAPAIAHHGAPAPRVARNQ